MSLSNQQLIDRKKGIGGSDAAAVLGLSSYKTPLDVYLEKKNEEVCSISNIYMEVGNHMEPFVRDQYSKKICVNLSQPKEGCTHRDYPWMRCNLDFISDDESIIGEIKFTSFFNEKWGHEYTDDMPTEYLIQCAHNCIVAESFYNKSYDNFPLVAFGFGKGLGMREYVYKRNTKLEKKIINAEKHFWKEYFEKNNPPQAISAADVCASFKEVNEGVILADDDMLDLYRNLKEKKFEIKQLEEDRKKIEVSICNLIGNNSYVLDDEGKRLMSWKSHEFNRIDTSKLKKDSPDLYNQYLTKGTARVLRVMS